MLVVRAILPPFYDCSRTYLAVESPYSSLDPSPHLWVARTPASTIRTISSNTPPREIARDSKPMRRLVRILLQDLSQKDSLPKSPLASARVFLHPTKNLFCRRPGPDIIATMLCINFSQVVVATSARPIDKIGQEIVLLLCCASSL